VWPVSGPKDDGTSTAACNYDANKNCVQVISPTTDDDNTTYVINAQYDANHHVAAVASQSVNTATGATKDSTSETRSNQYDDAGRLTAVHYVYNNSMSSKSSEDDTYAYDRYGRISDIKYTGIWLEYGPNDTDMPTVQTAHTKSSHYSYKNNRLVKVSGTDANGSTFVISCKYKNGRIVSATRQRSFNPRPDTYTFTYDANGRLSSAQYTYYNEDEEHEVEHSDGYVSEYMDHTQITYTYGY